MADSPLTEEQMGSLAEIHEQVHAAQKRMAAVRGELELEVDTDPALKPFIDALGRKARVLGHVRDDLVGIPGEVGRMRAQLAERQVGA